MVTRRHFTGGAVLALLLGGCASTQYSRTARGERDPLITGRLTGQQLRSFSKRVANKLRTEPFFINAVSDLRSEIGQPPNLEIDTVRNKTTQDNLSMEQVYFGFEQDFYATDAVAFTRDMPVKHLLLDMDLFEQQTPGENGRTLFDYELMVRVEKIQLSGDPDAPGAGYRRIGIVSDVLRLQRDKSVL